MAQSLKQLHGYALCAIDGQVGKVEDVLFDDQTWRVRFLVVETGSWLSGHGVVLEPSVVRTIDRAAHTVLVDLTRAQVQSSLDAASTPPVSRQEELRIAQLVGYTPYWAGYGIWSIGILPASLASPSQAPEDAADAAASRERHAPADDRHLRSMREVIGYRATAPDRDLGRVADFLVDGEFGIEALVVRHGALWSAEDVLVRTASVTRIDWAERTVFVEAAHYAPAGEPQRDADRSLAR